HHRDPFDRLIIAQSMAEDIPIVTVDSAFDKYEVDLIN
ncbi:MAG: PIN domain nuclease, partial [Cyanobacteria bacterium P01_A01_bin.45]